LAWYSPIEKADEFRNYLQNTGVSEAKALSGNKGVYTYSQSQNGFEHFFMVNSRLNGLKVSRVLLRRRIPNAVWLLRKKQ